MDFLCDYELLYLVRQQNEFALNALFLKYEKMLWSIIHQHTKHYPKIGFDEKDCMQYAYISFHQSMFQYREDRNASFSTFTYTCVDRRIRTVMRDLFRGNNMFYSDCVSMANKY